MDAKKEQEEKKFLLMTQSPVERLVCKLAVPTIISMMISSIYNMADTFFVGQIGTSASAAVGVSFSLMAIIQALGFMLGMGSGNYIARLLGQKNSGDASSVAATGFFTALIAGAALAALGLVFLDPLVRLLGATPTIQPYARDYVKYILIGMPYMSASLLLNNILRFQGSAFYGMLGIGAGGLLNIALDPIFIFGLGMGISGAALATIISQFVSFCILLWGCRLGGNIKIRIRSFAPTWEIYKNIFLGGMPSFYRQGLASVATICLNLSAGPYGDAAIAAMSIVGRVFQFAMSVLLGFGQGFQPVCGFNYGAKRYDRVLRAYHFCLRTAIGVLIVLSIIGLVFAPAIIAVFRRGDPQVIEIGALALRIQCLTFPFSSWIIINNMLLQTIGKSKEASFLSSARQGLFFLPAILILPRLFGLLGVQLSQPLADAMTMLLVIPMQRNILRELNGQAACQNNSEAAT